MNTQHGRSAGILMHITSLPGRGPIGSMGAEARTFVDFLQQAGQKIWQILPLTQPARGNSPYSSYSVFAGNPYLISPFDLEEEGLLPPGSCADLGGFHREKADFAACEALLMPLLLKCFEHSGPRLADEIAAFRASQGHWLEDYALFMALRGLYEGRSFRQWPEPILHRDADALDKVKSRLARQIAFWVFVQCLFFRQWARLREYANSRGIAILGDAPIYVDVESADVWAHSELFLMGPDKSLSFVAGVPPDAFSAEGQLWGNPLYDWEKMRETGYQWWVNRLATASLIYDVVRIDHFRALESYWVIPAQSETAKTGSWHKGPGMEFFETIRREIPHCRLIAEDLGLLTDEVRQLLRESGLPGLSVLLFAFDPDERSLYLPHNMHRNCIAYVGTHDNDTAVGWLSAAPAPHVAFARSYLGLTPGEEEHWGFIRALYATVADTVIVQAQDLLGLGNQARMNIPALREGNWGWRMLPGALGESIANRLRELVSLYER